MPTIYLNKDIELLESECEKATELAAIEFKETYQRLVSLIPLLESDLNKYYPALIIEPSRFEPTLVICEDWNDGVWSASYMFEISGKTPDGNPDCDYSFNQYDVWSIMGEPMYKDVYEPLYKCDWSKFKLDGIEIQFDAVNCVDSSSGNGYHFYNNHGWL